MGERNETTHPGRGALSHFVRPLNYIELHAHTCYSLREGASSAEQLLRRAVELGYPALAVTDHDGLYGAMEFAKAAEVVGIRPITGAEITLTEGYHLTLLAATRDGYYNLCRLISTAYLDHGKDDPEVTLESLRAHSEGLIALSGCARGEVAQWLSVNNGEQAELAARRYREWFGPENFFLELQNNLVQGDTARNAALVALAGRLELDYVATNNVHYHIRDRHRLHDVLVAIRNRSTLDASHTLRRPNSEFYLKSPAEMAELFTAYPRALENTLVIADRCRFNLLHDLGYEFPDFPLTQDATADDCLARICWEAFERKYGQVRGPVFGVRSRKSEVRSPEVEETRLRSRGENVVPWPVGRDGPPGPPIMGGGGQANSLVSLTARETKPAQSPASPHYWGAVPPAKITPFPTDRASNPEPPAPDSQLPTPDSAAVVRLEEELRLIKKHGLAGFFLTYHSILGLAGGIAHKLRGRDPSLPPDVRPVGRGRGSSVGSIVCYLIGLSHIDPVANKLFLGRFLNEELASIPDIDLDFPRDIRAELLERVYNEFGEGRAALVCSFPTYRTRSAVRDVGKALGLPEPALDKIAKMSDHWGSSSAAEEMARLPELRGQLTAPIWRDLIELTEQLRGFPRHISQHVGGIVLASRPIQDLVPVEPARMSGRFVCQWDKDSIDDARMVKIDFLALGMLSLVDECLDTIEARHGAPVDLGRVPHDDVAIYDRICAGDTIGVFQIESRAQIQTLPRTRPRNIDDLAVEVAIIRPGPIVSGAFHPYMEYRQRMAAGEQVDVHFDHPSLIPVLSETLGVILYQDQVLQVAMAVAGYTAGEADLLRRAMSRRRSYEALNDHWPRFLAGVQKNNGTEEVARKIFDSLLGFAAFGFPKSHAVAFGLLAYESTWLRHYYPAEYYAALLNNQPMGFYSPEVITGDARRHGVLVVQPDINLSGVQYRVESDTQIRLGLSEVRSVGTEAAEKILAVRQSGPRADGRPKAGHLHAVRSDEQPFLSLFDFARRTGLLRAPIENLILAGAFDSFGLSRRELLWQLGLFYAPGGAQGRLDLDTQQDMVPLAGFSEWETVIADFNTMGLSPRHHPLSVLRKTLPASVVPSAVLEQCGDGAIVQVAGMVVCRQRPGTAKGVVFVLIEDEFGLTNVVVYAQLHERQRPIIRMEPFVVVRGRLQIQHGTINLVALDFRPLRYPLALEKPASRNFY